IWLLATTGKNAKLPLLQKVSLKGDAAARGFKVSGFRGIAAASFLTHHLCEAQAKPRFFV
ncbi:MAG: hypothetical protein K2L84_00635, partial [Muribaculaceae bacterium]|nr:hypothetical protein [Muribaculaceae bacterium]